MSDFEDEDTVEVWRCNCCGHSLTEGDKAGWRCPHCGITWCGDGCCGNYDQVAPDVVQLGADGHPC